jgi:CheY-like chemotaxis protein
VLLAEDNAVNRELAVALLRERGHRVAIATNGREAVEGWKKSAYDVVLMDVQMPELDGLAATRAIREQERSVGGHIPIIAMTAHALQGDRERCLEAGMDGYVSKPIRPEALYEAVESAGPSGGAVDAAALLARVNGNRKLLRQVARVFLGDSPKLLAAIRSAVRRRDAEKLRRAAHTLKGAVGNFAARRAYDAALRLEVMGQNGDWSEAAAAYQALAREIAGVQKALGALVSSRDRT